MLKNKPLFLIVFFLLVSILIAIYFQYSLVKKIYTDKKEELEYEFVEFIEHALYQIEEERNINDLPHEEYHENITSYILKSSDTYYSYRMDEEGFKQYLESSFNNPNNFKVNLKKDDYSEIKRNIDNYITEKNLKVEYTMNFVDDLSFEDYEALFESSNLIIDYYSLGTFGINIKNQNLLLFSGMMKIIISSLFFILTMVVCGTLLIKKYLNEKKLSVYKNEFINNLTHELQTPITVSGLALEKLTIDLEGNEMLKKYLLIVEKENKKLEKLSKRILKLAEIKTVVSENDTIDVSKSIRQVVKRYDAVLEKEDTLLTDLNHIDIRLVGNKELFIDMLDNLVSNAIKYSISPRLIVIKTNIKNGKLHLSIKDNGIGIPMEFEDKIFTPFFKVPKNNTHEVKSNGLGLSYVAEIVKQMKGDISMSSEMEKGTTFNIILPYEN